MSIVSVNIRPHLVAFFFKEFEGKEANYLDKKAKAVKIQASSSLGRMMTMFMVEVDNPSKLTEYYQVYLSVVDGSEGKEYTGDYYRFETGKRSLMQLPPQVNHNINVLLEDQFRISFIAFMDGYMQAPEAVINNGIDFFIDKYDLLETGFSTESMRQLYWREKKKPRLSRLQERPSNRVSNYF
jgi:hypothetical protein